VDVTGIVQIEFERNGFSLRSCDVVRSHRDPIGAFRIVDVLARHPIDGLSSLPPSAPRAHEECARNVPHAVGRNLSIQRGSLMKSQMHPFGDPTIPSRSPSRLRPTWMNWMWRVFIVAIIVLSTVAFLGKALQ